MSTTLTARQTFRELVAEVAEKAKAKLPTAVNGRIESAVKLVLMHDVMPQADGSILVGSSSDPLQAYLLVGTACECQDFTRGQAPDGWCQHRIAAGIQKRVRELLPPEPAPDSVGRPTPMPPGFDNGLAAWETPAQAVQGHAQTPAPLPEAPASVNCHLTIAGRQVQLTLRDTDEARLLQRLQAVLAQYPVPQPGPQATSQGQLSPQQYNAAAMHKRVTETGWCEVHKVAMQLNQKNGQQWYSHRAEDGTWCKGTNRAITSFTLVGSSRDFTL
jgi:hypothetical protein